MFAPTPRPTVPRGPAVKFAILGLLLGILAYIAFYWQGPKRIVDPTETPVETPVIEAPQLDRTILAEARDATREQRLVLEAEPLSHLLEKALNVSPPVAEALGRRTAPVPVTEVAAAPDRWRGEWLWYRGRLEELAGPKPGHPVRGYSIWEATIRTSGDETVLVTFSLPPEGDVHKGGIVRAEGFLLKIRDLTFPNERNTVPMLVGNSLLRDYEAWPPVTSLDPAQFAGIRDGNHVDGRFEPGPDCSIGLFDDQAVPLWHLGSYALHEEPRLTKAEWREKPAFASKAILTEALQGRMERGAPVRILGQFVQARTQRAVPNPAGIEDWTEAWVQIRDLGGKTVPVWIPGKVRPLVQGTGLEVNAFYYKRIVYETLRGTEVITPVFVATELEPFVLRIPEEMHHIALWLGAGALALTIWIFLSQRRLAKQSSEAQQELARRRRQRRAMELANGSGAGQGS